MIVLSNIGSGETNPQFHIGKWFGLVPHFTPCGPVRRMNCAAAAAVWATGECERAMKIINIDRTLK